MVLEKSVNVREKEELKGMIEEVLTYSTPTIYTTTRHISKSGMSRSISVFLVLNRNYVDTQANNPQIVNIDYYVEKICERKRDRKNGGVKIGGCGMDMGFALVDDLLTSMKDYLGDEFIHGRWQSKIRQTWM